MKPGAHFKQLTNASADSHCAFGWFSHAGENFEQCAFTCAVTSDNAKHFSLFEIKRDIVKRPDGSCAVCALHSLSAQGAIDAHRRHERIHEDIAEHSITEFLLRCTDPVLFA